MILGALILIVVGVPVGMAVLASGPPAPGNASVPTTPTFAVGGPAGRDNSPGGGTAARGGSAAAAGPAASSGSVAGGSAGAGSTPAPGPAATSLVPSRVIKNAQVSLQVRAGKVGTTVDALTVLGGAEGGFVASTSETTSDGGPTGSVTLRIPAGSFEDALSKTRAMGKVVSSTASGQDVTAQYVDLSDRITALREAQDRYLAILARTGSIPDLLAVQQQVDAVDSQLQQLEGQQRVLEDQTSYGTLAVSVHQPGSAPPPPRPAPGPWHTAFTKAANRFAEGIQGLIAASGSLAFALLMTAVVGVLGRLAWRRIRHSGQTHGRRSAVG